MKDLVSHIVSSITGSPVEVVEEDSDGVLNFKVVVPKDYVGMVIGRNGKTINAIKNVLKIKAIKEGVRVDIQITEG